VGNNGIPVGNNRISVKIKVHYAGKRPAKERLKSEKWISFGKLIFI